MRLPRSTCMPRWPPCHAAEREVVVMHYFLDQSVESIANELEIPAGTVKAALHRARTRSRGSLADRPAEPVEEQG